MESDFFSQTSRLMDSISSNEKDSFNQYLISNLCPNIGIQNSTNAIASFYDQGLFYNDLVSGFQIISKPARNALKFFLFKALQSNLKPIDTFQVFIFS